MKCLVVYSSQSGNTRKLAQGVVNAWPGECRLCTVEENPDPRGFDLVAVGFWLKAGMPDAKSQEYLGRLDQGKVFLFATHGAASDSDHAKAAMAAARDMVAGADVVGAFSCQGEVNPKVLAVVAEKNPQPPWLKDAPAAAGHPDEADIRKIGDVVRAL